MVVGETHHFGKPLYIYIIIIYIYLYRRILSELLGWVASNYWVDDHTKRYQVSRYHKHQEDIFVHREILWYPSYVTLTKPY